MWTRFARGNTNQVGERIQQQDGSDRSWNHHEELGVETEHIVESPRAVHAQALNVLQKHTCEVAIHDRPDIR